MGFGIIGAALSGAMTGGGAALQTVGKQQWEKQMNDERDAAQFERQKNLATLQSELGIKAHAANSATDTAATGERAQNALDFSIDNEDTVNDMAARKASSLADNSAQDASRNQPMNSATAVANARALQPIELEKITATGDQHARVANITAAAHLKLAANMENNSNRLNEAADNLKDAYDVRDNAKTPEEIKNADIGVNQAERAFKIFNGKTTGSDLGPNNSTLKLKQASEMTKQIKDANANLLTMPKEQRAAETLRIKGLVQQQANIMSELTGQGGSPKTFSETNYDGSTPKAPAAAPSVRSAPTDTPAPSIPADASLADKRANAPPAMQALQAQLLQEVTALNQLKQSQSGIVSREKVSSNTRARDAQEKIVEDLKGKLNTASEEYGSYPWGRF